MGGSFLGAAEARSFRGAMLKWFDEHKRELPWRRTRDPYAIWVSEIMLQQTRVAAVLDHYARWMERWPTVGALAAADEPAVLAQWSGLGYYRRARFLHAGARAVVAEHGGAVPCSAAALRGLPGVGEYTAAAVASIAFGEPVAVVDGNVERVVTRLAGLLPVTLSGSERVTTGLTAAPMARRVRAIASELLDGERAGDFNQAMMELGATVCLPRGPLCLQCPVVAWCQTRGEHAAAPGKTMRSADVAYALVERHGGEGEVLLVQRPADVSLMAGMWELPTVDGAGGDGRLVLRVRHAITVTNYAVTIFACGEGEVEGSGEQERRWVGVSALGGMALTGLTRKVLRRLGRWPAVSAVECRAGAGGGGATADPSLRSG